MLPLRKTVVHLVVAALSLVPASGCSSRPLSYTPPTIAPATPAVSPATAEPTTGVVLPLDGRPVSALFDTATSQLAVLRPGTDPRGAAEVVLVGRSPTAIPLPGPATALADDGHGTLFAAMHGGYAVVSLPAGHVSQVRVGDPATDFTAIARRADGRLALGTADGSVYLLSDDHGAIASKTKIFARVDALAAQGNTVIVLDRGQTVVTTISADGHPEQSLRAGAGATTLAVDPQGRALVADTRGGNLLVYGVDPLMLRQSYPVPDAPYGVTGSTSLAWVSQTASNTVIGFDLSTGIPVEKVRYRTVRQPDSLAFDDASGTLYVISGSGAGVHVIANAAGRP